MSWRRLTVYGLRLRAFLVIGLGWLLLVGVSSAAGGSARIPVAASILPLGDFCQKIGGERVRVQVLIPPGASPHVFEPTPSAVAQALAARLFVYVGGGLDPWAERLLKSQAAKNLRGVEAVWGLELIQGVEEQNHQHRDPGGVGKSYLEHEEHHMGGNPHVWLDPVLVQDICRRVGQALMELDPLHRQVYEANLAAYVKELEKLHQEISAQVQTFRRREYVCFHPAFAYFARRYHLREAGVIELSPGREPTPRQIQRIVQAIRFSGVKAVFAEPQLNPRVAEVIAKEAGAKVVLLDPLGGVPPYGGDYLALMRHNLSNMLEAMR